MTNNPNPNKAARLWVSQDARKAVEDLTLAVTTPSGSYRTYPEIIAAACRVGLRRLDEIVGELRAGERV